MRRATIIFLLSLLLVLLVSTAGRCDPVVANGPSFDPDVIIHRFFSCIEGSDFQGAASLLHCPEEYSESERSHNTQFLVKFLQLITGAFGKPLNHMPNEPPEVMWDISIEGGKGEYWKNLTYVLFQKQYQVAFEREGSGLVSFRFAKVGDKVVLRQVSYGFRSSTESRRRIDEIMHGIAREMMPVS